MMEKTVDMINLRPLQAGFASFNKSFLNFGVGLAIVANRLLGGNRDRVTDSKLFDHTADHLLISALLVHGGSVEMANAKLVRAAQKAGDVGIHDSHADDRQLDARFSEGALQYGSGHGSGCGFPQ